MRIVGIIQARMSSSRLPGKVLMPLVGTTSMLELIVKRLANANVDDWWIATTSLAKDDPIAELATRLGLRVQRGNEDDVLSRFVDILRTAEAEWVVRITADCPLVDAVVTDMLVELSASAPAGVEVISQAFDDPAEEHLRWAPLGYVPEIARADAVMRAASEIPASQPYHRAHVLTWLYREAAFQAMPRPASWPAHPEWRWTVDTHEDLAFIRAFLDRLGPAVGSAGYLELGDVLTTSPELLAINAQVRPKPMEAG
jgi:spore coat polysaccharide biosynthesis protein SpsF